MVSLCGVGREGHVNPPVGLKEKSTQQTDAEMHVGSLGCEGAVSSASKHMAACRESALNTAYSQLSHSSIDSGLAANISGNKYSLEVQSR